uniref:Uncharacterized protein n=1 Tax=Leersia perrieri TaxID=77586 RepID=A0A0D9XQ49_9ORYZ
MGFRPSARVGGAPGSGVGQRGGHVGVLRHPHRRRQGRIWLLSSGVPWSCGPVVFDWEKWLPRDMEADLKGVDDMIKLGYATMCLRCSAILLSRYGLDENYVSTDTMIQFD